MHKQLLLLCSIALSSAFAAVPAYAQALNFTLTGSRTATFTLDDSIPDSTNSNAFATQIFFNNVAGTFGGTPQTASSISFGTGFASSFEIVGTSLGFTQFGSVVGGGTLFTGSLTSPTFNLGTFNIGGGFGPSGTLTISRVNAAVPEPATWAMMLMGFGAMGVSMRRRRRTQQLQAA